MLAKQSEEKTAALPELHDLRRFEEYATLELARSHPQPPKPRCLPLQILQQGLREGEVVLRARSKVPK